jgi:prefoldin alpha subunit
MNAGDDDRKLQEKMVLYRVLEDKLNEILARQNAIASRILEIQGTLESISEIADRSSSEVKGKDILFPIGCSTYVKGAVSDREKVIVGLGAGTVVEKTYEEARKILEDQKGELQLAMSDMQKEMSEIARKMQGIEADAQSMMSVGKSRSN